MARSRAEWKRKNHKDGDSKRTGGRPRWSQAAQRSPNTERRAPTTGTSGRRGDGPVERRRSYVNTAPKSGTCSRDEAILAVVTDAGDLRPGY